MTGQRGGVRCSFSRVEDLVGNIGSKTGDAGVQIAVVFDECEHLFASDGVDNGTLFPGFCVTQPIVGVAAVLAALHHGVDLDLPLSASCGAELGVAAAGDCTLREVLEHRSGFSQPGKLQALLLPPHDLDVAVREAARHPGADGKRVIYGDYVNPRILEDVISIVTGKAAADWMAHEVLQPLGLGDTYFAVPEPVHRRIASRLGTYQWRTQDGRLLPLPVLATAVTCGDLDVAIGGLTSARDLAGFYARVARALHPGRPGR